MKIEFECSQSIGKKHNVKLSIASIVLHYPMCCGSRMTPVNHAEWRRVSTVLNELNIIAREKLNMTLEEIIRGE